MTEKDDPEYWLKRAEEARAMVDELSNPDAKVAMRQVAKSYETLAALTKRLGRAPT
jgi:hypothetical protein